MPWLKLTLKLFDKTCILILQSAQGTSAVLKRLMGFVQQKEQHYKASYYKSHC